MSESFTTMSIHLSQDTGIECMGYPDRAPILALTTPNGYLHLSLTGKAETDTYAGLLVARALLAEVEKFVYECERLHLAPFAPSPRRCKAS